MKAAPARSIAATFALVAVGLIPPSASAATEIGAVSEIRGGELPSPITAGGFAVQAAEAAGTYVVPAGYGTITAWSHSTGTASGTLTFKVYRPTGALKEYAVVGSDTRSVTARTVESFPVRIAVNPGDRIGLSSEDVELAYETNNIADRIGFFGADLPLGAIRATDGEPFPDYKLDVAATLEPMPGRPGAALLPPGAPLPSSPSAPGQVAPVLSQLRLSPAAFRAAPSGPSARSTARRRSGAKVSYRSDARGEVDFVVRRKRLGRRSGTGSAAKCVAQTPVNRRAAACTREVPVPGAFTRTARTGSNSFYFTGRMGGRKLVPGAYVLVATPGANAKIGSPVRRGFTIRRRGAYQGRQRSP